MITHEIVKECRNEFEVYLQNALINSPENHSRIQELKSHSQKVSAIAVQLASFVLQSDEDKRMAEIIALLHDIGKAELYSGKSEGAGMHQEHALASVKIIQQMNLFSLLTADNQVIVIKSVENHSKLKLPKLDTEQQTLFARLLRDADKLDIYDSALHYFKERVGIHAYIIADLSNSPLISEKILKSIQAGKTASFDDVKTMNDYKLLLISMAFDLNYKYTFRMMSEKQYIQKIYETLPKRDAIIDAYRSVKLFIENKFVL